MKDLPPGNIHMLVHLDEDYAIELFCHEDDTIMDVLLRAQDDYPEAIDGDVRDWEVFQGNNVLDPQSHLTDYLDDGEHTLEGSRVTYELHLIKKEPV